MKHSDRIKMYLNCFEQELIIRNYAFKTRKNYLNKLKQFLLFSFDNNHLIPYERIREYLNSISVSPEVVRQTFMAIKIFYDLVVKKECPYRLDRQKRKRRLPRILSNDEIKVILSMIANPRQRLMISMLYASGLRISEVVRLKVSDVDLDNLKLMVRNSKGNKDRLTLLSPRLILDLKREMNGKAAKKYLFVTINDKCYSTRTVQIIFEKALIKSGLQKTASCHTLRHSFATHLLESSVDVKTIKELMGHRSIKTTMAYLHVADTLSLKVKSPF